MLRAAFGKRTGDLQQLQHCKVLIRWKSSSRKSNVIPLAKAGGGGGGINRYLDQSKYTSLGNEGKRTPRIAGHNVEWQRRKEGRSEWKRDRYDLPRTKLSYAPREERPENPLKTEAEKRNENLMYEQLRANSGKGLRLPSSPQRPSSMGESGSPTQAVRVEQTVVPRKKIWKESPTLLPEMKPKDFLPVDDWPAGEKKPACLRPRHLKRWERDMLVKQQLDYERSRIQDIEWMKNYLEIDERIARRKIGLPELPEVHEPLFMKRKARRGGMKKEENHAHRCEEVWTTRPRDISSLHKADDDKWSWRWFSYDKKGFVEPPMEKIDEFKEIRLGAMEARAEKRMVKFEKLVERLPAFQENVVDEQEPPHEEHDSSGNVSNLKEENELPKEFEIPPMIPGRGALLVAGLYDLLKDGKWEDNLGRLEKFKYAKLLPYQVCQVLKQLKDWRVAFEFFRWAAAIPEFKHDTYNYSTMIMQLGKCGNYIEARKLYDEMVHNHIPVDHFTMNNMIKCYGRASRIDEAVAFYNEVIASGISQPDHCTYTLLVDLYGKAGRVKDMTDLFMDMKASNLTLDSYLFNSIIYNFGKWGNMSMVKEAVDQMQACGVKYTTVTYATLIHLYGKVLDFKSAEQTYSAYLQSNLAPDIYVFNSMVQSLGVAGRCREAEWAMEDIERAGLAPDACSYCTIISAWGRQGCAVDAKRWFDKAHRLGVTPTPVMCNAMIDAYLKADKLESVESLLKMMHGLRVKPTLETYTYLFNVYTESREEIVKKLRDLMGQTGHPADKFLDEVFEGKTSELRKHSQEFFESMRFEKPGATRKFANAVIHYLHIFGYEDEANRVFEAALASKVFPGGLLDEQGGDWIISLVSMDPGTALVGLSLALGLCKKKLSEAQDIPRSVTVIAGIGKHVNCSTSLAVKWKLIEELRAPFEAHDMFPHFEADGLNFVRWVRNPYRVSFMDRVCKDVVFTQGNEGLHPHEYQQLQDEGYEELREQQLRL